MNLLNHTCPTCGGTIQFEPGIQKVVCQFCRNVFDAERFRPKDSILDKERSGQSGWNYTGKAWLQNEQAGMVVFSCRSCGAEIVAEATQGTATCIFCRKPAILTAQFSGTLRPDLIIPFKLRKEEAIKALEKHYLKKTLLPKAFKDYNHIKEVKGVYVPFWLFDALANSHITFTAEKVRTWSDSSNNYTETSYYRAVREGALLFSHVPVDGSKVMDDKLMESIEPYNMQDSLDFQTVYLTGFFANKFDVDSQLCFARADERIRQSTISAFQQTVKGFDRVNLGGAQINLTNREVKYGLLPVWMLTTIWKDKEYVFAMNGQTGKFIGDLPLDKSAKNRWFLGLTLGVTAAVSALVLLLWTVQGVLV